MSRRGDRKIVKGVGVLFSNLHSTSMHNAIDKLSRTPINHIDGRSGVEKSILHLVNVHRVKISEKMKYRLKRAQPSEGLLMSLFPEEFGANLASVNRSPVHGRSDTASF